MSGSSHHSLSIDGSKPKVMADFQTSSIGHPVISSQYVRIRGVGNQVLDISPCQIRTGCGIIQDSTRNTASSAYFASSVSAIVPDTTGVAALVPSKSVTHSPSPPVVAFGNGRIHMYLTSIGCN